MGGTFNPLHMGHLVCAEQVRQAAGLSKVVFLPAGSPSFKRHDALVDAQVRAAWVRDAIAANPYFELSLIEVERAGITYTVDTLELLHEEGGSEVELCFLVGTDAALTLPRWHEAARLAKLATFIVVNRPGFELGEDDLARLESAGFKLECVTIHPLNISSTEIRRMVQEGKSVRYLVPENVYESLRTGSFYQK
jgi:nicotinate-nucleotide adenylyltransferase